MLGTLKFTVRTLVEPEVVQFFTLEVINCEFGTISVEPSPRPMSVARILMRLTSPLAPAIDLLFHEFQAVCGKCVCFQYAGEKECRCGEQRQSGKESRHGRKSVLETVKSL